VVTGICNKLYYSDMQKSVPVKLARLLLKITIGCCFDSHPRIDNVLQNSGFRHGLLENAIAVISLALTMYISHTIETIENAVRFVF
jgi:hypothetical protein